MGISEIDRRVAEFSALIKCQLRLVQQLEQRGKDSTSAKIILGSLRESFFVATQSWHRGQCTALHPAELASRETPMIPQHDRLNLIDKIGIDGIEEQGDKSPIVQETSDKRENGPPAGHFEFRPLTEEEKKEFLNSLGDRGKQILAELEGRAKPSHKPAARAARVAVIHGLPVAAALVQGTETTERLETG